ncbi:MAG: pilus assembly protein N-terminal domain-containing protein, partial [Campylobacter sp.]|nr:pilus assembly protein N-terminal domain-containing protein [Campylobacter sp.]
FAFIALNGEEITLKKGETRVFTTKQDIATVFSSDPKVVDYNLIGTKKMVVFATGDGSANVKAFGGENSEILLSVDFLVDSVSANLENIEKIITKRNPGVKNIKIDRLSIPGEKGYVISGEVPDTRTQEDVYKMALAALGLSESGTEEKKNENRVSAENTQSSSSTSNDTSDNDYKNSSLIDKLKLIGTNLINVELVVADVQKSFLQTLGIDINNGGVFTLPFINGRQSPLIHGGNLKDTYTPGQYTDYMPFSLTGIITAINNDQVGKILAKPNVSVLSGREASFSVTDEYTSFEVSVSDGVTTTSPKDPKKYGISLSVRPTIENNGKILIEISQSSSDISSIATRGEATEANIKQRSLYSTILLEAGQSFAISGLIAERDDETVASIPGLGDIPVLGGAFRKSALRKSKSELVILATVKIVQPLKDNERYKIPVFKSRKLFESLLNIKTADKDETTRKQDEFLTNIDFIY